MTAGKILVVESNPANPLTRKTQALGFEVHQVSRLIAAESAYVLDQPGLVLIDQDLQDGQALSFVARIRELDRQVPIVLLLDAVSIDETAQAARAGADKFLSKPVDPGVLGIVIAKALELGEERRRKSAKDGKASASVSPFFGSSRAISRLEQQVKRVLALDRPVLIQGETGVGKSMLARWIHSHGPRSERAFVELNCAGLSKELLESDLFGHEKGSFTGAAGSKPGMMEVANLGTLFLDEIGDMDLAVQPKILKAVEEQTYRRVGGTQDKSVDLRLIGASHRDLGQLVAEGKFRSDLFYRVAGLPILVPPLRERQEDIALLAAYFMEKSALEWGCGELELSPAAVAMLEKHPWNGNIRELKNAVERAVIYRQDAVLQPLDFELGAGEPVDPANPGTKLTLAEVEEQHIRKVLEACDGRVDEAARWLDISRSSLYQRIRRQGSLEDQS
ncbi:MAG: sigma-54-dependent Fis family transcriptional regulator [Holophagaceae bacterium]|nr:sigma-54-dependent Fis family transcriptional regulator [Holophagaceae bacterium]